MKHITFRLQGAETPISVYFNNADPLWRRLTRNAATRSSAIRNVVGSRSFRDIVVAAKKNDRSISSEIKAMLRAAC